MSDNSRPVPRPVPRPRLRRNISVSTKSTASTSVPTPTAATDATASTVSAASASTSASASTVSITKPKLKSAPPKPVPRQRRSPDSLKFKVNGILHIRSGKLQKEKYNQAILLQEVNPNDSSLLLIDITGCKNVIYPISARLYKGSTVEEVYNHIIDALKSAEEKNIACQVGTTLNDYTLVSLDIQPRYIYVEVEVKNN